jgi:hypothetical protein
MAAEILTENEPVGRNEILRVSHNYLNIFKLKPLNPQRSNNCILWTDASRELCYRNFRGGAESVAATVDEKNRKEFSG